jgi:hypothetical protein
LHNRKSRLNFLLVEDRQGILGRSMLGRYSFTSPPMSWLSSTPHGNRNWCGWCFRQQRRNWCNPPYRCRRVNASAGAR